MSDYGDAIDALIGRIVKATADISLEGGLLVEGLAKSNAPIDTGTLMRSIDTTGPSPTGVASFATFVGPTVIYGRLRELGGFIPGGAVPEPKPPGRRDWLHWVNETGDHFAKLVHQDGRPYLKPAVDTAKPQYLRLAAKRWADVIRST